MDKLIIENIPSSILNSYYYIIPREIIGTLATIFTAISLIPQICKTLKTKRVEDLSCLFLVFYSLSIVTWLIYGILLLSIQTVILELFLIGNMIFLIHLKIKYTLYQKKNLYIDYNYSSCI